MLETAERGAMPCGGREAGKDLQGHPHSHETELLEIPVLSHVPSGLERGESMAAVVLHGD